MQEIHPIGGGGGGGRIFSGGDRRLRPLHHQSPTLKCPRCDSQNTKFCYYNNYNLSQPRHFCKSCRRYWTKGGVLRNVPVGGGCRKSKRSRPKPPPPSSDSEAPRQRNVGSSCSSSSESSSLTGSTTAATAKSEAATAPLPPASDPQSNSSCTLLGASFPESIFFLPQSTTIQNPSFETAAPLIGHHSTAETGDIFPEIGSFTSLISDPAILSYNVPSEASQFRLQNPQNQEGVRNDQEWPMQKMTTQHQQEETTARLLDQTVQDDLHGMHGKTGNSGLFPSLDWQSNGGDLGFFDLSGAVDQAYWSQNQWTTDHHDHPLYLP